MTENTWLGHLKFNCRNLDVSKQLRRFTMGYFRVMKVEYKGKNENWLQNHEISNFDKSKPQETPKTFQYQRNHKQLLQK